MTYQFTVNKSQHSSVLKHLTHCSSSFIPPLESTVDLDKYSKKIVNNAQRFEAWIDDRLIGLVAVYMNDLTKTNAFITNVSLVKEHWGKGIAKKMVIQSIDEARKNGFKVISLEVSKENKVALALYRKLGFDSVSEPQEVSVKLALPLT